MLSGEAAGQAGQSGSFFARFPGIMFGLVVAHSCFYTDFQYLVIRCLGLVVVVGVVGVCSGWLAGWVMLQAHELVWPVCIVHPGKQTHAYFQRCGNALYLVRTNSLVSLVDSNITTIVVPRNQLTDYQGSWWTGWIV